MQLPSQRHGRLWPPEFRHHEPSCPGSEDGPPAPGLPAVVAKASEGLGFAPCPQCRPPTRARTCAFAPHVGPLKRSLNLDRRLCIWR